MSENSTPIRPAAEWPFAFTRERFLSLPASRRQRIEDFAQGIIEGWEASSGQDRHGKPDATVLPFPPRRAPDTGQA